MTWRVERIVSDVATIHGLGIGEHPSRLMRVYEPTHSAIVLGSTQPETDVDQLAAAELGVDIVRRRSGGGAVLVEPNDLIWFDIVVPVADSLWRADVGAAFHWLGDALAAALSHDVQVHKGPLISNDLSKKVCFAGLGPGEITLDGKKVVGISQRRSREGALFQVAVLKHFDIEKLSRLLNFSPTEVELSVAGLPDLDTALFIESVLGQLDRL